MILDVKRWLGRKLRASITDVRRWTQPAANPRVLICPGFDSPGSSRLRAWEMAGPLRKLGWRATVVPPELDLVQRQRIARAERPDVILLQHARHALNRPGNYAEIPCVFDIDDADFLFPYMTETIRECCSGSVAVTAGSRYIAQWCAQYNPLVRVVWTGSPAPRRRAAVANGARKHVVTWACSDPLAYAHDFEFVCRVLRRLRERVPFEFWLFGLKRDGDADGRLDPLRKAGIRVRTFRLMPYGKFLRALEGSAIGLCPLCVDEQDFDRGKSFGKVLAYLVADVAVVAGYEADHALFFKHGVNGLLCRAEGDWPAAIEELLVNPAKRQAITDNGFDSFVRRLSSLAAARELDAVLRAAVARARATGKSSQDYGCGAQRS